MSEKNHLFEKSFGPKKVLVKKNSCSGRKILSEKNLGKKNFGPKIFFGPKLFFDQKIFFCPPKHFGSINILGLKKNLVRNISKVPKKFWIQIFFDTK